MAWTERYCRADAAGSGNGTTNTNSGASGAWTFAEAIANYAAGHRVNIKAGTYANTTNNRTFTTNGSQTQPVWFRGFNTTIGDIDTDQTLTKPAITFGDAQMIINGAYLLFSNLDISGAKAGAQLTSQTNTNGCKFYRCRVENTYAGGTTARCVYWTNGNLVMAKCWIKASTAAAMTAAVEMNTGSGQLFLHDSTVIGGQAGVLVSGSGGYIAVIGNVIRGQATDGFRCTAATVPLFCDISRNSFYAPGSDGIEFTVVPTGAGTRYIISNNIFNSCVYGINNSSGTNNDSFLRFNNLFYNSGSGNENGFGDSPSLDELSDSASSFVNAGSSDFTPAVASNARNKFMYPGTFENETFTGYGDVGAVRHADPASGPVGQGCM